MRDGNKPDVLTLEFMQLYPTKKVHADGRPMSDTEIGRGLAVSTLAGFLGMPWSAITMGVPLTMLLECLTGSGLLIGLVLTRKTMFKV